jgi:hypothetical protein
MFDLCELSNVPLPGALRRRQEPSSAILFHAPIRVFVCDCWCGSGRKSPLCHVAAEFDHVSSPSTLWARAVVKATAVRT